MTFVESRLVVQSGSKKKCTNLVVLLAPSAVQFFQYPVRSGLLVARQVTFKLHAFAQRSQLVRVITYLIQEVAGLTASDKWVCCC